MVNRKALLIVASALVTALILSSLAVMRTARSQDEVPAATLMLLQIDGIPGESAVLDHEHWIDIDAFAWSEAMASLTSAASGRSAGKLNMTAFHFAMTTNNASVMLFLACATGRIIPHARLDVCRSSDGSPGMLLQFDFAGVTITSYSIAGNAQDYHQYDEFSIAFSKITMTYWQYDDVIGVAAYYDLIAGRGGIIPP
jgi:type VI secretion system secreted protein Hcp